MANNHMGNVDHGLKIIREIHKVSKNFDFHFGFKLQYRELNSFIHPEFKQRFDFKYIKRFLDTRLDKNQFKALKDEIYKLGFTSVCTPFDEKSVDLIEEHGFDIIKIGSCSFTDWPLLEKIIKTDKPIIASTAGSSLEDIDRVVSFFEHRRKTFALMHCVAEYPTQNENLQLNQIDLLKSRYSQINIGYSTHENPQNFDSIKIAIAKGATIFEKHVGLKTEKISLNAYSATPKQIHQWLRSAQQAFKQCGHSERPEFSEKEKSALRSLRRGIFANKHMKKGKKFEFSDIFLAIPTTEDQITANDLSKYTELYTKVDIDVNQPIFFSNSILINNREKVYSIAKQIKRLLKKSKVVVPGMLEFEISHHYGIDKFVEYGCTIINVVNREYCKKLIILLPGQKHPEQFHKLKEETFQILYGNVLLTLEGVEKELKTSEIVTIERGTKHAFSSKTGAVIEEISSTHKQDDSYYSDKVIKNNKNRKTYVAHWLD